MINEILMIIVDANSSQLSSGLFPKGSNDTSEDFLTNDHFKVLNMTFIHIIMIRCYGPDLFNHTVTWYRRFLKIKADNGLLWIDSWIISTNSSCCCPDIPDKMKKSDVMGLTKLDLSMIVFVSWQNPPKTPLILILFLEMSLYCL